MLLLAVVLQANANGFFYSRAEIYAVNHLMELWGGRLVGG